MSSAVFALPENSGIGQENPTRDRHFALIVVLVPAVALRVLAMVGYQPVLWFWADSFSYLAAAADPVPSPYRPLGYPLALAALGPAHSLALVAAVQHVLGLAAGVGVYALLRRRGLSGWTAAVVITPLLYDEFVILLEHMVMADALFTVLVVSGILVLLTKVTPATAAIGGTLLGVAGLTRTIGVLLLVPAAGYLLLRRTGWRCLLSFVVAGSSLLTAYAGWTYAKTGTFGLTRADGLFLWARTMTFADCDAVRPEPRLAVLCPPTPVSGRPAPAFWLWSSWSPLHALPRGVDKNLLAGRFAHAAIAAQPGDYLAAVGTDLRRLLRWERTTARSLSVKKTNPYWFPFEERPLHDSVRKTAESYQGGPAATRIIEPFAGWLRAYQRFGYLPFPLLMLLLGGALGTTVVRRRHDALLPALAAAVLTLAPPFLSQFDVRYVIPAIPLTCLAGGLAIAKRPPCRESRPRAPGNARPRLRQIGAVCQARPTTRRPGWTR
ncbi:hypothetical protein [Microtetraspora malaysiensis]|uniref:Glycosyltransferase RgtA/B/C/D-like domain-containing protein n=1 Tax=Microtetraspora malaysiensis TaxID=161358 RepID=A0ABW6SLT2_9ACTN